MQSDTRRHVVRYCQHITYSFYMQCVMGSKAPRRNVESRNLVNKHSLPNVWQVSLGNAEPAVATGVGILTVY
jgi:hypothetical protein